MRKLKRIGGCVALAFAAAIVVTMHATEVSRDWARGNALASVAVSFNDRVVVYYDDGATEPIDVPGTNHGIAFDNALNLLVAHAADVNVPNRVVRLGQLAPHAQIAALDTDTTQPRALAVAGDGSVYVAAVGGTILRFPKTLDSPTTFTVPVETSDCIGIDLGPNNTLYVVSGGRNVFVANLASNPVSTTPFTPKKLAGSGKACAVKVIAPERGSDKDQGGVFVADGVDIKRLNRFGQEIASFKGSGSMQNWVDVAIDPRMVYDSNNPLTGVDPNEYVFWGIDAGLRRIARFRTDGGSSPSQIVQTGLEVPRSIAVNGELRFAQAVRPLTLLPGTKGSACYPDPSCMPAAAVEHRWTAENLSSSTANFAVVAFEGLSNGIVEVTPDLDSGRCEPSLDLDCRFSINFPVTPTAVAYSRSTLLNNQPGRAVVYRVVRLGPTPAISGRVGILYADANPVGGGQACVAGGTAISLLRDPYLATSLLDERGHDQFESDNTRAFFDFDDGTESETLPDMGTDYIAVARSDVKYTAQLHKPDPSLIATAITTVQLGSSQPINLRINDPSLPGCPAVDGLANDLVLTVTKLGASTDTAKGTRVGDSETDGSLGVRGLAPWVFNGTEWRTNLGIDPPQFEENTYYAICVNTKALLNQRLTNDACSIVKVVQGSGK